MEGLMDRWWKRCGRAMWEIKGGSDIVCRD